LLGLVCVRVVFGECLLDCLVCGRRLRRVRRLVFFFSPLKSEGGFIKEKGVGEYGLVIARSRSNSSALDAFKMSSTILTPRNSRPMAGVVSS
jgi:hypothetical protein